jgi:hypothetical protein
MTQTMMSGTLTATIVLPAQAHPDVDTGLANQPGAEGIPGSGELKRMANCQVRLSETL